KLRVPRYADDAECAHVLRQIEAEVLINGIFIAFEEAFHKSLVHDGHRRRGLIVGCGEVPSPQNWNAEILKIIGAHAVPRGTRLFVHLFCGMAFDQNQLPPVVSEWVVKGKSGTLYSRQTVEAIFDLPIKRLQSRQRI